MSFKFRKRIKILPGIYMNFSKGGFSSMSIGGYNTRTKKTTVNLPISGLSYQIDHNRRSEGPAGEYTTATIKIERKTMELLKRATGTGTNKACVEAIVSDYIERLKG